MTYIDDFIHEKSSLKILTKCCINLLGISVCLKRPRFKGLGDSDWVNMNRIKHTV